MIERSKLSDHKFEKGRLITPFNYELKDLLQEEPWYYRRMPEYLWLGLIINDGERTTQIQKCFRIIKYLNDLDKDINLLQMSTILTLSNEEQNKFYTFLEELQVVKSLRPLSLVVPSDSLNLLKVIKGYNISIEKRIEKLNNILGYLSDHQSNLSTDVRFLVLNKFLVAGKLQVAHDNVFSQTMSQYALVSHETPEMKLYRPTIRSAEIGISAGLNDKNSIDIRFVKTFWKKISLLTDCEVFYMNIENPANESGDLEKHKEYIYEVLNYYTKLLIETRPLDNKMLVLLGIFTFSYKRLIELVDHNLENTISGRTIMRSITESYMMTKYLLLEEPNHKDIWGEYQDYGIGQYKLIYGRYAEENPEVEGSHVPFEYINNLVSEFKNEEFINIDTKYFGSGNIRNKFKEIGEENLWKYYYDYDSIYEHGLWGAIRESSILKCSAPGHQYHGVPDIENIQKLPSVALDCMMIMNRHIKLLEKEYGLPENFKEEEHDE